MSVLKQSNPRGSIFFGFMALAVAIVAALLVVNGVPHPTGNVVHTDREDYGTHP